MIIIDLIIYVALVIYICFINDSGGTVLVVIWGDGGDGDDREKKRV